MKLSVSTIVLLLWSCIGFIHRTELLAIQKRATVCNTEACKQTAQYLLDNMNQTENPCVDFYQFSCGGFIAKNPLPADRTQYGTLEILAQNALEQIQKILESSDSSYTPEVNQAQDMYTTCLKQVDDIQTLQNEVQQLGGWPITETTQNTQQTSFESLLAKLTLTGTNAIIASAVNIDLTNSTNYILEALNGDLPVNPIFLRNEASNNSYSNFIQTSALALGATSDTTIKSQITNIIQFMAQLAVITPKQVEAINFTSIYQKMTIDQLQQATDPEATTFNWLTYFNEVTNLQLTTSTPIGVYYLDYLIKAVQLLKSTDKNTVLNYAIWCFVENYSWTAGGKIQAAYLASQKTLTGVSKNTPRNTTCTDFVNSIWGFALAKPYVAKAFPSSNIEKVRVVAQSILTTFVDLLSSNVSYLHGNAQKVAVEKVSQMKLLIGYPTWINNDTAVQEYFANYPAVTSSPVTNSLNAVESAVKQNLQLLGTPIDKNRFDTLPSDIDAEYDLSLNTITLPAALLQRPVFSAGQLQALNYGILGSITGVELNNGLDYIGSQFDASGNLNDWWSAEVAKNVGKDVTCVTEQYNNYCSTTEPKRCIDGAATALEHIADYDGIFAAYYTYEDLVAENGPEQQLPGLTQYTSEQLLFINFAQQFCTATVPENKIDIFQNDPQLDNRYRVIGALADVSAFATTFNCPIGPMNRGNASCIPF